MSVQTKFIVLTLMLLIISVPLSAWAAGLVPCGVSENNPATVIDETAPCSLCHLYVLIDNILDFIMWTIAPIVAVLAVGWAGFNIMISGEQPGLRAKGFGIIKTTVIGLAIMFAGWVLINEALIFFANETTDNGRKVGSVTKDVNNYLLPWNKIKCSVPVQQ